MRTGLTAGGYTPNDQVINKSFISFNWFITQNLQSKLVGIEDLNF